MVYYFTSNTVTPPAFIYVGNDKAESRSPTTRAALSTNIKMLMSGIDEDLIKYGLEEDVWYDHLVDNALYTTTS